MKQARISIGFLAVNNLKRKTFRTFCLIIIVLILSFTLFAGSVMSVSLKNGMNSMEQRLGADLMVVPKGCKADAESVLIKGEPSYFYFDKSVLEQVAKVEGVSQATSQFFLTSLSAECCSTQVQLIAIEPKTDFVIQPWIAKTYHGEIGDGQLIAGSDIILEKNHTLKLFNHTYSAAAQLEKTATGLDSSVFMNINTMRSVFNGAKEVGVNFLSDVEPEEAISSVLVKVKDGYDTDDVIREIRSAVGDADIIASKNMITGISDNLTALLTYIRALSAALWILAVVVLVAVFSVTINERKKEFAVFRILGATRKKLTGLVLAESLLIGAAGGVSGTAIASIVIFPFSTYIGDRLRLPYLQPDAGVILALLALSLLLSAAVGLLASICSTVKISRAEAYLTMREGE